jgi:Ca2+-transporting ATPase
MASDNWHHLPPAEVVADLGTDIEAGLSEEQARERLEKYGPNELEEQPRPGFLQRLIGQFTDLVVLLLIGAAIVSGALQEWYEAGAILLIVILNAVLGVVQEGQAEEALAALKKLSAPEARVIREGQTRVIPAREVVPGDVVIIEAGNYVPADLRLVEEANLQIEEASLTGESVPVHKVADADIPVEAGIGDRRTMAYKGTLATYGRGKGVAVETGMTTQIGLIAEMIQSVEEEQTPLQQRLDQLGAWLVYGALIICGIVFLVAFGRAAAQSARALGMTGFGAFFGSLGDPALLSQLGEAALQAFLTAVALAVAAVPEGLPAIVTINLAIGMREMARRNALIRRLPAVETLGSASAICSDKTGTLTQNAMTAVALSVYGKDIEISGRGYAPDGAFYIEGEQVDPYQHDDVEQLLLGAMLASDARLEEHREDGVVSYRVVGDPTEGALIVAAAKAGMRRERLEDAYPRVDELPFDSTRKRMSTLHRTLEGDDYLLFTKGAPDVLLDLVSHVYHNGKPTPLTPELEERIAQANEAMASQALRVLAVAQRRFDERPEELTPEAHEKDLTFIGLIGMIDPPRVEVGAAIDRARDAGIRTVMVTGDYAETARAIAGQIGLLHEGGEVIAGSQLQEMSDEELVRHVENVDVFARVSPEHKVRIVDAFRQKDYVVAMTGDGVNDAPALKRASIGVAMGITGTDVTKETADMVLTDDNYVSIVNAVEQGRIIYDNIRKFVYFLLSCNLAEIAVIFIGTLLGYPTILTPIQLLWLNLLTDGAPALALGVEAGDPNVMDRPPRRPNEPIIDRVMRVGMTVQTVFITAVTLGGFFMGLSQGGLSEARSIAFTVLSFSELIRAYTSRSEFYSVFRIGVFSNKYMQYAVLASIALLLLVIYVPFLNPIFETKMLTPVDWAEIIPLMLVPSAAAEITKFFMRQRFEAQRAAPAQAEG